MKNSIHKKDQKVCLQDMCNGCMACVNICKKNAIQIKDTINAYNAIIDDSKCINCGACYKVCPRNNAVDATLPIEWKYGWAIDLLEREKSSSGGIATAIMKAFTQKGGYVFSCSLENNEFVFSMASTPKECEKFRGSKYIKSNPKNVYINIQKLLAEDKKVLFLGLPCQVAGIKKYIVNGKDNLYTIDLICHGSPSPKILEKYLNELNIKESNVKTIDFRNKNNYELIINKKYLFSENVRDEYTIAFLNCLTFTENCYFCDYAKKERISDVSLGDFWGSNLPEEEKGISLILCQNQKGKYLLDNANIYIADADAKMALLGNQQLREPSAKPKQRNKFLFAINKNKKFITAVFYAYPKICMKQNIKKILVKYHFWGK